MEEHEIGSSKIREGHDGEALARLVAHSNNEFTCNLRTPPYYVYDKSLERSIIILDMKDPAQRDLYEFVLGNLQITQAGKLMAEHGDLQ